jgi:hypothetical protein
LCYDCFEDGRCGKLECEYCNFDCEGCNECGCITCFPDGVCGNFPCECYLLIEIADGIITIKNITNNAISTKGLYFSDSDSELFKWQMPVFIIRPNQSIQIISDDYNGQSQLKRGKTNFDMSSVESIYLTTATGDFVRLIDSMSLIVSDE